MADLLLTVDQGTTNTKALLVDRTGRPVFQRSAATRLSTGPDRVEQDAEEIWESVRSVIADCVAYAGRGSIAGVALSNQRETAVTWRRSDGVPLAPAISWQCRRSARLCEELLPFEALVRERTGLPLDPLITASKWGWLLRTMPELRGAAERGEICLGTVDSWLIWRLTAGAVHATDHSNASRTGLLRLDTLAWDPELLTLFQVPAAALPEVRSSSGALGRCCVEGLEEVPIVAAVGDSHAALAGHGADVPGQVKATYGTGSSLMMLAAGLPASADRLARTVAWSTGSEVRYALEGNVTMTGAAVQWVGEFLGLADPTREVVALAGTVADAGGVYLVPAMVGLGAPYWDAAARGLMCGLERGSTKAHMARAAVESIAYQVADVFHALRREAGIDVDALHVDGGASRNDRLMQFQADLLQVPVRRAEREELSALGAAWLGGVALGWWESVRSIAQQVTEEQVFLPGAALEESYRGWRTAVARARRQEETA